MKEENGKILGVIGGMGPLATQLFYRMVIESTDAERDQDHINMIILNHATMPDRTTAILNGTVDKVLDKLSADAQYLADGGATCIAIPCNTTHAVMDELQTRVSIPIINMVRSTAEYVSEQISSSSSLMIPSKSLNSLDPSESNRINRTNNSASDPDTYSTDERPSEKVPADNTLNNDGRTKVDQDTDSNSSEQNDSPKVGIMATTGNIQMQLYQNACREFGLEPVIPSPEKQKLVMKMIYDGIKSGGPVSFEDFEAVSGELQDMGAEKIILGCTELSVIREMFSLRDFYVDAMQVLTDRAVEMCKR